MHIPYNTIDVKMLCDKLKKVVSIKGIASMLCMLLIVLVGALVIHHRTISAAGEMTVTQLEPIQRKDKGQVPSVEQTAQQMDQLATKPSIWPVSGEVTSGFGWRVSPWGGGNEWHPGIDIANNMNTPIVATADGVVVQSEWSDGYGNLVKIDHGNGIETLYGHNSRIAVTVGQRVRKGQVVSYLGSTGKSTGPHAHYEVRVNGTAVDPVSFLVLY